MKICDQNRLEVVPKMTFYSDYAMIGVWDRSRLMLSGHPYLGLYSLPLYCSPEKFYISLSKISHANVKTTCPKRLPANW